MITVKEIASIFTANELKVILENCDGVYLPDGVADKIKVCLAAIESIKHEEGR